MRLVPWNDDSIVLYCTNRLTHPPMRVGETDEAGIVWTIGGDKDGRQPSPRGVGPSKHPEVCPECKHTSRHGREYWQAIVAAKRAIGESTVDVSYLPNKLPNQ